MNHLEADPSRAKAKLGWPQKHSFDDLVRDIVESDRYTVRHQRNSARFHDDHRPGANGASLKTYKTSPEVSDGYLEG